LGVNIHFGLRAHVNAVIILKAKTYTATQGTGKAEEKLQLHAPALRMSMISISTAHEHANFCILHYISVLLDSGL